MARLCASLSCFLLASFCCISFAWGMWPEDGANLCGSYAVTDPAAVNANEGHTIVAWRDSRGIYAQRYDAFGNELWGSCGAALCTETSNKSSLVIAPDGADGAYVAWVDYRSGNADLYAQRVNASGVPQWSISGVALSLGTNSQIGPQIISDGVGGAYVTWEDSRMGTTNWNIYAIRLNASGLQWAELSVCYATGNQRYPVIVSDDARGFIVAWQDMRNGVPDVYAQRVDQSGTRLWTENGVVVCNESHYQQAVQMTADCAGGAIITWADDRAADWDIYAQRVSSGGSMQWTANGIPVCSVAGAQTVGRVISDGEAGAFIVWPDFRYGSYWIFAQRVNGAGTAMWGSGGIAVSASNGEDPALVTDGMRGIVVSWSDCRIGTSSSFNIYAQRLDPSGNACWEAGGVPVCTAPEEQRLGVMASDGSGGGVIVWRDYRTGSYEYYVQRIERNGYWGYPCPAIEAVRDTPGDQGGYVNLAWNASRLDPWPNQLISYYSLWKAIDPTRFSAFLENGASLRASLDEVPRQADVPIVRKELAAGRTFYWELVATQNANYYETYSKKLATDFDSTGVCDDQHYFQVCAHSADPKACWTSPPDSGYSVDNLPPCTPVGLQGEQSFTPEGLTLTWDRNGESDFDIYAVYRGLDEGFEPSLENRIASTCDTALFDGEWRWDGGYWYKISAFDVHGNESGCALLAPEGVTDVETPSAPEATRLMQNVPNPFNPTTRIGFELATAERVSLRIYDSAGRLVKTLLEGDRAAGRYAETWDGANAHGLRVASGVYFYRLSAGRFEETRKMVLLK